MSRGSFKRDIENLAKKNDDLSDREKAEVLRQVAKNLGSYSANGGGDLTVSTGSESAQREF